MKIIAVSKFEGAQLEMETLNCRCLYTEVHVLEMGSAMISKYTPHFPHKKSLAIMKISIIEHIMAICASPWHSAWRSI